MDPVVPADPITSVGAIPVGGGVILREHALVVTQPTPGTIVAFSAVCPHQQCLVRAVAAGVISCFCHGSRFRITDGSVVGGPAPEPSAPVAVVVTGDAVFLAG